MRAAVHARNVLADLAAQGLVVFSVIVLAALAFAGRHQTAPATLASPAPRPTPRQGADLQPNVTATAVIVGGGAAGTAPETEK